METSTDGPRLSTTKNTETTLSLSSVRELKACRQLYPNAKIIGEFFGLATSVKVRETYAFFYIHDGTDSIQVAARSPDIAADDLKRCSNINAYDRLHVKGYIVDLPQRDGSSITTLVLTEPPTVRTKGQECEADRGLLQDDIHEVGNQLLLARVRDRASEFFRSERFLSLETRSISTAWPEAGVRPLRLDYPGYGAPVFLIPSPRTQLLKAIIVTGRDRVFAISKCFSPTYRDRLVSSESPFVSALWLNASLDALMTCAESAVKYIFADLTTAPSDTTPLNQQWQQLKCTWPPIPQDIKVDSPEFHLYEDFAEDTTSERVKSVFRLCWPPDVLLVEGAIQVIRDDAIVGTLSIHLERLSATLQNRRRQVQDLSQQ